MAPSNNKLWSSMEASHHANYTPSDTLLLTTAGSPIFTSPSSPSIKASLLAWKKFTYDTPPIQPTHSYSIPLRALMGQIPDLRIQRWHTYGINSILDLTLQNSLKTFKDLQNDHHLPDSEAYTHARISHFLKTSKLSSVASIPEELHGFYSQPTYSKHDISIIYAALMDQCPLTQINTLSKWKTELNLTTTPSKWQKAFKYTYAASHCSNHWETYQKTLHRWYLTPYRLSKIYTNSPPTCWRNCGSIGTIAHLLWFCKSLSSFWR